MLFKCASAFALIAVSFGNPVVRRKGGKGMSSGPNVEWVDFDCTAVHPNLGDTDECNGAANNGPGSWKAAEDAKVSLYRSYNKVWGKATAKNVPYGSVWSVWVVFMETDALNVPRLIINGGGGVAGRKGIEVDYEVNAGSYSMNNCMYLTDMKCPGMTSDPVQPTIIVKDTAGTPQPTWRFNLYSQILEMGHIRVVLKYHGHMDDIGTYTGSFTEDLDWMSIAKTRLDAPECAAVGCPDWFKAGFDGTFDIPADNMNLP